MLVSSKDFEKWIRIYLKEEDTIKRNKIYITYLNEYINKIIEMNIFSVSWYYKLRENYDIPDVISDLRLRIIEVFHTKSNFKDNYKAYSYIYRICYNHIVNLLRLVDIKETYINKRDKCYINNNELYYDNNDYGQFDETNEINETNETNEFVNLISFIKNFMRKEIEYYTIDLRRNDITELKKRVNHNYILVLNAMLLLIDDHYNVFTTYNDNDQNKMIFFTLLHELIEDEYMFDLNCKTNKYGQVNVTIKKLRDKIRKHVVKHKIKF